MTPTTQELWLVTVERTASVEIFVAATSKQEAREVAEASADDAFDHFSDFDYDTNCLGDPCPITNLSEVDDQSRPVLGDDGGCSVRQWFARNAERLHKLEEQLTTPGSHAYLAAVEAAGQTTLGFLSSA